ncbi:MAG: NAD-dependent epimerase/dehydratase family protein [Elusimicrobiota bacterium]|nr:NAD-dependent epimerase/dehydratase family protein [Elusimicrobiota bacterium]
MRSINFITGAAGFIGSNLTDRLLYDGHKVIGYDNFSTGQEIFLKNASKNPNFNLLKGDLLDEPSLTKALKGVNRVWHFAANADVRFGIQHPKKDLEQNTIATANVLEAMRSNNVKEIYFSSTGSVYGEAQVIPTDEDCPFPVQTSLYGASKLACEGMIAAYCEGFDIKARVFRFVSILGERYTHGHIFDFVKQLKEHPNKLSVLGDGNQRKSYLYVQDCIEAMLFVSKELSNERALKYAAYNLGADEYCAVKDSIGWITKKMGLDPKLSFSGGDRGWIGDNPFIYLDTKKVRSLGWNNKLSIRQGIEKTVDWLLANDWVYSARG